MTRATGTTVLIASLVLVACGGDDSGDTPDATDHSANFVGRWDGTSTMTLGGLTSSDPVFVPISRVGTNTINLGGFCGDGSGPNAVVTSSSSFNVNGLTCPPMVIGTCSAVTFAVKSGGTGSLANGTLAFGFTGSMTGCGQSFPLTATYSGTRTSTNPQALTVEPEGIAAAIKAQLAPFF